MTDHEDNVRYREVGIPIRQGGRTVVVTAYEPVEVDSMSWDAWLTDDRGHIEGEWNHTHNTSSMIYVILEEAGIERPEVGGREAPWYTMLHGTDGETGKQFLMVIANLLEAEPERFDAMNPANGWGSRETLLETLREMIAAVPDWPCVWSASG